jgi:hypothetical protein
VIVDTQQQESSKTQKHNTTLPLPPDTHFSGQEHTPNSIKVGLENFENDQSEGELA